MRQVPIKQLYKALSKELADLPFQIIRRGVIIATVQGLDNQKIGLDRPKKSRPLDVSPIIDQYFKPMPKAAKGKKSK